MSPKERKALSDFSTAVAIGEFVEAAAIRSRHPSKELQSLFRLVEFFMQQIRADRDET